jgi:hypothetical protein
MNGRYDETIFLLHDLERWKTISILDVAKQKLFARIVVTIITCFQVSVNYKLITTCPNSLLAFS